MFAELLAELAAAPAVLLVLCVNPMVPGRYHEFKSVVEALEGAGARIFGPPPEEFNDDTRNTDFRFLQRFSASVARELRALPRGALCVVACEGGINRAAAVVFGTGLHMGETYADMKAQYDSDKVRRVQSRAELSLGHGFGGFSNVRFISLFEQLSPLDPVALANEDSWCLPDDVPVARTPSRRGAGGAAVAAPAPPPPTPKRKRKGMGEGDEHPPPGLSRSHACMYTPDPPREGTATVSRWHDPVTGEWKLTYHFKTPPTTLCADPRPRGGGGAVADARAPSLTAPPKRMREEAADSPTIDADGDADDEVGDDYPPLQVTTELSTRIDPATGLSTLMFSYQRSSAAAVESPVAPAAVVVVDDSKENAPSLKELGRMNAVCPP